MRLGFVCLLLLVATIGHSQTSQPQPTQPAKPSPNPFLRIMGNGTWWTTLSDDAKDTFVDGYVTAMDRAHSMTKGTCDQRLKESAPSTNTEKSDAELKCAIVICSLNPVFEFDVGRGPLRPEIDEFYKDARNVRIPIDFALQYGRDKLKGKMTSQELQEELNHWREMISNHDRK